MLQMNPPTERVSISKIYLLWYREKIWEICCSDEKEEVSPCKQFKIQRQIQHYPIGVGLLPTHHDKNNERSSEIPPLGHYIETKNVRKWTRVWIHIITSLIISYFGISRISLLIWKIFVKCHERFRIVLIAKEQPREDARLQGAAA